MTQVESNKFVTLCHVCHWVPSAALVWLDNWRCSATSIHMLFGHLLIAAALWYQPLPYLSFCLARTALREAVTWNLITLCSACKNRPTKYSVSVHSSVYAT